MGEVQSYKKKAMHPSGTKVFEIETIAFTGHSETEITNTINQHYASTHAYPEGNKESSYWTWGYFQRSREAVTVLDAERTQNSGNYFCMKEKGGPGEKFFEGSLKEAKSTFNIFNNNKDVILFVKFDNITETNL